MFIVYKILTRYYNKIFNDFQSIKYIQVKLGRTEDRKKEYWGPDSIF